MATNLADPGELGLQWGEAKKQPDLHVVQNPDPTPTPSPTPKAQEIGIWHLIEKVNSGEEYTG